MAESLRDLVVSLSLNTDNFTRNIKSVNKQIQEAESFFKLASAGIKDFDTSAAGLAARLGTLQSELTMQGNIVQQYERALEQANNKLSECYTRQGEYAGKLEEARTRQAAMAEEVARAQSLYNEYKITLGETNSATIAAGANLEAAKAEYSAAHAEVQKLVGQNDALKRSTQNAADAVSTIQTQLNKAQAAFRSTQADIEETNQKLALAETNWASASDAIESANGRMTTVGKLGGLVNSQYRLAGAGVKDFGTSTEGLQAKVTQLTDRIALQRQTVSECATVLQNARERVQAAQDAGDPEKVQQATDAVIDAQTALNNANAALRETEAELSDTQAALATAQSAWTSAGITLTEFGETCDRIARSSQQLGRRLTTMLTTPIVALGTKTVKANMDFESSFTSVRKTVDATEEEFESLAAASRQMSTEIAASTTEINETMAIGGQLGVYNEYLTDFTRIMIDLGNSCEDLSAEEAAESIAKFANIMGTDQSMFKNIGSTIVELGNNFATTEKPIMLMAQRLAGAGRQVGLTEAEILGFAAGLSSVGIEAQMGGSAFSKALIKMEVAAETGGDALDDFAKVSGMTAEEFKAVWDADPSEAFMSFILGLSKMDEEGISAIATLNDMGIAEIRLRDTLLRATNATDLFYTAQDMANAAWAENTALTDEANKRYATTTSQMTNLKNKAMLFAETIGGDMMPTIKKAMEGISAYIDRLMDMDSAQRQEIIKWAAIAAAAGPAIMIYGKVTKTVGAVAKAIGKFATVAGEAGGGLKGFNAALLQSPKLMIALCTAIVYGSYKLYDWASGAKAAREALEGLEETAENWKNHTAETFYGTSEGLSAFDLTESDFIKNGMTMSELLETVTNDWKDDLSETDETVEGYVNTFKEMTKTTRDELTGMANTAKKAGYGGVYDGIRADMAQLDLLDQQIAGLLEKRKEYYLSDEDIAELNRLISVRQEIEIKYGLSPADSKGFDSIEEAVELAEARAQSAGLKVANEVYENALVAAGEGMAAVNDAIDKEYDARYKLIQTMTGDEQKAAMAELTEWYNEQRRKAGIEYADTISKVIRPVMATEEFKNSFDTMTELYSRVTRYAADSSTENYAALSEYVKTLDEDSLVEYYGVLTQISSLIDQGLSTSEISQMTGVDGDFLDTALTQIATIQTMLKNMGSDSNLNPLREIFSDFGGEVLKISTDLDMTGATARWKEFAENPGADVLTTATVTGYNEIEGISTDEIKPVVTAVVSGYIEGTGEQSPDSSAVTPLVDGIVKAYVEGAGENAPDASVIAPFVRAVVSSYIKGTGNNTPDAEDIYPLVTAAVNAYVTAGGENAPDPGVITPFIEAVVSSYVKGTGNNTPDASEILPVVTAAVNAYILASGEDAPDADEIAPSVSAYVEEYLLQNGKMPTTEHVNAYVTGYVSTYEKGTGEKAPDTSEVNPYVTAYVESYTPQNVNLTGSVTPSDLDATVVQNWKNANKAKVALTADVTPTTVEGAFGADWFSQLNTLFEQGKVEFYGANGLPVIDVDTNLLNTIDASDIVIGVDKDGVYHVTVKPSWEGADYADAANAAKEIEESGAQWLPGFLFSQQDALENALALYQGWAYRESKGLKGVYKISKGNVKDIEDLFNTDAEHSMANSMLTMVSALNNGEKLDSGTMATYEQLTQLVGQMVHFGELGYGANTTFLNDLTDGIRTMGYEINQADLASWLQGLGTSTAPGADMITDPDDIANYILQLKSLADEYKNGSYMWETYDSPAGLTQLREAGAGLADLAQNGGLQEAVDDITAVLAAGGSVSMDDINLLAAYADAFKAMGEDVPSDITAALQGFDTASLGFNMASGLANGILNGQSGVVAAMMSVTNAALAAARESLGIHSPSRVFRDEVGEMMMRGLGEGVLQSTEEQAKIIRNAARYLTGEAAGAAMVPVTARNTSNSYYDSVNISGNDFNIRSEQDIRELAREIAALTKRQQAGRGTK